MASSPGEGSGNGLGTSASGGGPSTTTTAAAGAPAKKQVNQGGRPRSKIWEQFTQTSAKVGNTKRANVQCKFCEKQFTSRVEGMVFHIANECKSAPPEAKLAQLQALANKAQSTGSEPPKKKLKGGGGLQQKIAYHIDTTVITGGQKQVLDAKLLKLLVMCNIPFSVASSPWFLEFLQALRPNYSPADSFALRNSLLLQEAACVDLAIHQDFTTKGHITLTLDGWTDAQRRSLYTYIATFPDRQSHVLKADDCSEDKHTSEHLAERALEVMAGIGFKHIIALVTDNAANMLKMRRLIVADPRCKHIIELRCYMHAFALFIGSALGYPWAAALVAQAQRIVTYFRASHRPLALLNSAAKEQQISRGLQTSNKTRFTSVHNCLQSVLSNERPLQIVVERHSDAVVSRGRDTLDPKTIIQNRLFWIQLEALCKVLEPYSQVVMAVQSRHATLADVARYFLFLGQQLKKLSSDLAIDCGFLAHCIQSFNKRWSEMDTPILHLALFLHPFYKKAADKRSLFSKICQTAGAIWKNFGHSPGEIMKLMRELQMYKLGQAPFNVLVGTDVFDPRLHWESVRSEEYKDLPCLAVLIFDIIPHAGDVERVFSMMGWMQNDKRNRLGTGALEMLAKVKTYHQSQNLSVQKVAKPCRPIAEEVPTQTPPQVAPPHAPPPPLENDAPAGSQDVEGTALEDPLLETNDDEAASAEELASILTSFYRQDTLDDFLGFESGKFDVEKYYDLDDPIFGNDPFLPTQQPSVPSDHGTYNGQDFDVNNVVSEFLNANGNA